MGMNTAGAIVVGGVDVGRRSGALSGAMGPQWLGTQKQQRADLNRGSWSARLAISAVWREGFARLDGDPTLEKIVSGRPPTSSGTTRRPADILSHTMTTIWRPHWLIKPVIPVKEEVPDDDVPDVKVEPPADDDGINAEDEKTHLEGKGAKRKRGPPTKGPCEHGVKPRSKCKVCSACPHGRRRSRCKECGGSGNLRARSSAHWVQGVRWCINLRARSCAL